MQKYLKLSLPAKLVVFAISVILFFYGFRLFFSTKATVLVIISLFLHEVGHFIAFRAFGYKSAMLFLPMFGAAVIPYDNKAMKNMPRRQEAIVALAGPSVNILLMFCGLFASVDDSIRNGALAFAALNASLAAFNLLPFFILDGGRFAYTLYASADEAHDRKIALGLSTVGVVVFCILFGLGTLTFTAPLFIWGVQRASGQDDPKEHLAIRSMKNSLAVRFAVFYGAIAGIAMLVTGLMEHWNEY